jgi:hypothetical protein
MARKEDSVDFCGEISSQFLRDACSFATWRDKGCAFENIVGESVDVCIFRESFFDRFNLNVYEFCDDLDVMTLEDCRTTIAIETGRVEVCEERHSCMASFSLNSGDISDCLGNEGCINSVVKSTGNVDYCDYLDDGVSCFVRNSDSGRRVEFLNNLYSDMTSQGTVSLSESDFGNLIHLTLDFDGFDPVVECPGLNGQFKSLPLSDLCFSWHASKYHPNLTLCDSVGDVKLKSCCNTMKETFLKDDDDISKSDYPYCGMLNDVFGD